MKKTIKTKLRLNSQTIRSLRAEGLHAVNGGYVTAKCAATWNCPSDPTDYCTAAYGCGGRECA